MKQLQLIATETLANLTQFRKARNTFRRHGAIPRLVDLLDVDTSKVGFCPEIVIQYYKYTQGNSLRGIDNCLGAA